MRRRNGIAHVVIIRSRVHAADRKVVHKRIAALIAGDFHPAMSGLGAHHRQYEIAGHSSFEMDDVPAPGAHDAG